MWWKVITFCVLVCVVLFVVLSCIGGRPATHLLFHRCCEDGIENDEIIMENFRHNFLRERLTAIEFEEVEEELIDAQDIIQHTEEAIGEERDYIEQMSGGSKIMNVNVHDLNKRNELFLEKNRNITEKLHELPEEFGYNTSDSGSAEKVTTKSYNHEYIPHI